MKTIFNQPIINLDKIIDIDPLLAMKPRISATIANNSEFIRPTKYSSKIASGKMGINDYTRAIKETINDNPNKELLEELIANDTLGTYLLFEEENLAAQGSFSFTLQYEKGNSVEDSAVKHKFDFVYDWVESQNIFDEYLRVGFFITWKDTQTFIHKDWDTDDAEPLDSIHVNFTNDKKLFLIDPETNEKIYLTGYCNWFDTRNWHGSDPATRSCYSFRVIGKFKPEFLEKIKSLTAQ